MVFDAQSDRGVVCLSVRCTEVVSIIGGIMAFAESEFMRRGLVKDMPLRRCHDRIALVLPAWSAYSKRYSFHSFSLLALICFRALSQSNLSIEEDL